MELSRSSLFSDDILFLSSSNYILCGIDFIKVSSHNQEVLTPEASVDWYRIRKAA